MQHDAPKNMLPPALEWKQKNVSLVEAKGLECIYVLEVKQDWKAQVSP